MCTWVLFALIYRAVRGDYLGLDRYTDKYLSNLNDPDIALIAIGLIRYDLGCPYVSDMWLMLTCLWLGLVPLWALGRSVTNMYTYIYMIAKSFLFPM